MTKSITKITNLFIIWKNIIIRLYALKNKAYKGDLKRALKQYLLAIETHRLTPTGETFTKVKYERENDIERI